VKEGNNIHGLVSVYVAEKTENNRLKSLKTLTLQNN